MKRFLLVVMVLLVSMASFAAEKVIFEDDFEDLDQWFATTDLWLADYGALVFPEVGFGDIFAGEEDLENYAVECDILPLEYGVYGSVRLFLRMNELWHGYGVAFHPEGYLVHIFEGNWDKNLELMNADSPKFPAGKVFKVRAEVNKNIIKIFVNGELIFEGKDEDDLYFEGMFGFRADHSACEIKNFKVYKL